MNPGADERPIQDSRADMQICPYCRTQVVTDLRKRNKTVRCHRCKGRFPVQRFDGAGKCANCGTPVTVPFHVVGRVVECPRCQAELRPKWDYDP